MKRQRIEIEAGGDVAVSADEVKGDKTVTQAQSQKRKPLADKVTNSIASIARVVAAVKALWGGV